MDYSYHIRLRRATQTQWALENPILANGEPGFITDTLMYKIGDGVTRWNDLELSPRGMASTIEVGTTTTGEPGTNASVVNSGTSVDAVLDFTIPRGDGVIWKGEWAPDNTYDTHDVVRDGEWTMVANKPTSDRPAPQPSGDVFDVYSGASPTANVSAKRVTYGQKYTNPDEPFYIQAYRVWTLAGQKYDIYTNHNGVLSTLISFIADENGWTEFATASPIVPAGTELEILVQASDPPTTPVDFAANYNYSTPQNYSNPLSGEAIHSRSEKFNLAFSKTDNDGGDRSAELAAMAAGDTIKVGGTTWTIQSVNDGIDFVQFVVSPPLNHKTKGVLSFTFTEEQATTIALVQDENYWLGNANVSGSYSIDGADWVYTDDAYGVDVKIQAVHASPDWDILSKSGGGAASGGGGDYVAKTGDTMTGDLMLPGDPTASLHAATKQYVDKAEVFRIYIANPTIPSSWWTPSGGTYDASTPFVTWGGGAWSVNIQQPGMYAMTLMAARMKILSADRTIHAAVNDQTGNTLTWRDIAPNQNGDSPFATLSTTLYSPGADREYQAYFKSPQGALSMGYVIWEWTYLGSRD